MNEPRPLPTTPTQRPADNPEDSVKPPGTQIPHQDATAIGTPLSAGARYGRFALQRFHAKGGLGEVFLAEDEQLHREVALKEIRASHADDPVSRARFVQEAEITGRLEHPGIVPVYGLGQYADGRPFYAMRLSRAIV